MPCKQRGEGLDPFTASYFCGLTVQMSNWIVRPARIIVFRLFLQLLFHNIPRLRLGNDLKSL